MKYGQFRCHVLAEVEADETYLGGLEKNKHTNKKLNAGRGIVGKQVVLGARSRTGKVQVAVAM